MPAVIKFGTSGWRAIMAEDFTFANVRRAVTGIARYVAAENPQGAAVILGRDPRFLGESFVSLAAEILAVHGVIPRVISEPAPTPAISYAIIRTNSAGAINFTASHNPPEYNGIKFSTPDGAPALPEVTKKIEAEIASVNGARSSSSATDTKTTAKREELDVAPDYLARLGEIIDLATIKKAGLRVAYDPLWGAARGYPDQLLRRAGIDVVTVHDYRDVLFGGHAPEPDDHLLDDLRGAMKKSGAHVGISTDGDADRFGILDGDGAFISPNYMIALLFDYLVETRGWRNGVAKSVATTNLVNALAEHHKVPLYETPVGFKYIGELIDQDKIAIGGEESAGLSIRHHVPEKDGVLAGLLCCEMMARRGRTLRQQLDDLFAKVGSFYPRRENFRLTPEVKEKFTTKVQADPRELGGRRVREVVRTDGLKLIFDDGSWVCYRLSGTEPVVRVYSEARTTGDLEKLSAAAKQWIFEWTCGTGLRPVMSKMFKCAVKYRPILINTARGPLATRVLSVASRAGHLIYDLRTKLATAAVAVLAILLAVHVIFGANGMVVYQGKKSEYRTLQKDVDQLQKENQELMDQIKALKSDPSAIEREAREQLHYARPGEVIYLTPGQQNPSAPPPNAAARK